MLIDVANGGTSAAEVGPKQEPCQNHSGMTGASIRRRRIDKPGGITVPLPEDLKRFVQMKVRSGRFAFEEVAVRHWRQIEEMGRN